MQLDAFSECFSELHDPRQSAKISYPLFDILFLTVCAVIGGSEGWEDIEDFGQAHSRWRKGNRTSIRKEKGTGHLSGLAVCKNSIYALFMMVLLE